jgi:hypothetical protein
MDDDVQEAGSRLEDAGPPPSWPLPRTYADLSPAERREHDRYMAWMAAVAGKRD